MEKIKFIVKSGQFGGENNIRLEITDMGNKQKRMILHSIAFYNEESIILQYNNTWIPESTSLWETVQNLSGFEMDILGFKKELSFKSKQPYMLQDGSAFHYTLMIPVDYFQIQNFMYRIENGYIIRSAFIKELGLRVDDYVMQAKDEICAYYEHVRIRELFKSMSNMEPEDIEKAYKILDRIKFLYEEEQRMDKVMDDITISQWFCMMANDVYDERFVWIAPDKKVTKEEFDQMDFSEISKIQMEIHPDLIKDWSYLPEADFIALGFPIITS